MPHLEQLVAQEFVVFTVVEIVVDEAVEKTWKNPEQPLKPLSFEDVVKILACDRKVACHKKLWP